MQTQIFKMSSGVKKLRKVLLYGLFRYIHLNPIFKQKFHAIKILYISYADYVFT